MSCTLNRTIIKQIIATVVFATLPFFFFTVYMPVSQADSTTTTSCSTATDADCDGLLNCGAAGVCEQVSSGGFLINVYDATRYDLNDTDSSIGGMEVPITRATYP